MANATGRGKMVKWNGNAVEPSDKIKQNEDSKLSKLTYVQRNINIECKYAAVVCYSCTVKVACTDAAESAVDVGCRFDPLCVEKP